MAKVYKVDYDKLHNYCKDTKEQTNAWVESLKKVQESLGAIEGTNKISGVGADNVKAYYQEVHGLILTNLLQLISMHQANALVYKSDYHNNVDGDDHTHVETDETEWISDEIEWQRGSASGLERSINETLTAINDLLSLSKPSVQAVQKARDTVETHIETLNKAIVSQESTHSSSDFTVTEQSIRNTKALIAAMRKSRNFPNTFNAAEFYNSKEFRDFYSSAVAVNETLAANEATYNSAYEADAAWEQRLVEEREQKAKLVKIGVMVAVAAIGVIVSVATAGVASPLVGAGIGALVGGAGAAATSMTNDAMDVYVRDGDFDDLDKDQMMRNAGKAFVIGAATSLIGSGVSAGVEHLGKGAVNMINPSLYAPGSSSIGRFGAGVVVGATSKVTEGVVTRYTEKVADGVVTWDENGLQVSTKGEDWKKAHDEGVKDALDGKKIAKDAVSGGTSGAIKE